MLVHEHNEEFPYKAPFVHRIKSAFDRRSRKFAPLAGLAEAFETDALRRRVKSLATDIVRRQNRRLPPRYFRNSLPKSAGTP
jgi:hypothetical protein